MARWLAALPLVVAVAGGATRAEAISPPAAARPEAVASVAVDAGGAVWLVQGAGCPGEDGKMLGVPGAAWRSADDGATWRLFPVVAADEAAEALALAALAVDGRHEGHVLVRTLACCRDDECEPGRVLLTLDGGATWRELTPPVEPGAPKPDDADDDRPGLVDAAVQRGDLSRVAVRSDGGRWWVTADRGASWTLTPGDLASLPGGGWEAAGATRARTRGCTFEATGTGLRSTCDGGRARRVVFPNVAVRQGPAWHVLSAAGRLRAARLVDPTTRETVGRLSKGELRRLDRALKRARVSDGWAATTPPWDAPLVLTTTSGKEVVVHLVAAGLRINLRDPYQGGAAATDPAWRANAADLTLDVDDSEWLWEVFAGHLGPTRQKEYQTPEELPAPFILPRGAAPTTGTTAPPAPGPP